MVVKIEDLTKNPRLLKEVTQGMLPEATGEHLIVIGELREQQPAKKDTATK